MNIAISGASGFVGSYLKQHLKEHAITEVNLSRSPLDSYNFRGIDAFVHLAGIAHRPKGTDHDFYFRVNSHLAYSVASKAKREGVAMFVLMSTVKVYCDSPVGSEVFDERSSCNPTDAYGRSKLEAERQVVSLADENFTVAIIRSPMVYGPGVKANMLNLIKLVDRLPILPFGGLNNVRSLVFIGNLAAFIMQVIERRAGGVFIPLDERSVSTFELTRLIAHSLGKKPRFVPLPVFVQRLLKLLAPYQYSRLLGSFQLNNRETENALSFNPPYSVEQGIEITVSWYILSK